MRMPTYLKVFNDSRFVSKAMIIAIGVNKEGYREILDISPMENEAVSTYFNFFDSLKEGAYPKLI